MVEEQFETIEKQVKEEVKTKMEEKRREREAFLPLSRSKAKEVWIKSRLKELQPKKVAKTSVFNSGVKFSQKGVFAEAKIKKADGKLDISTQSKNYKSHDFASKSVHNIPDLKFNGIKKTNVTKNLHSKSEPKLAVDTPKYDSARFEVLSDLQTNISFQMLKPPVIIDKSVRTCSDKNGLFKMKHVDQKHPVEKMKKMTCHRLPGVNIRPELVKENIPGFSFMGFDRKPNKKISVQHVVDRRNFEHAEEGMDFVDEKKDIDCMDRRNVEIMENEIDYVEESGRETNRSECLEDFSITDSTTSKFEVIEKMLLQKVKVDDETDKKVEEKPMLDQDASALKFKIEMEALAKEMIRAKVVQILDERKLNLDKHQIDLNDEKGLEETKEVSRESSDNDSKKQVSEDYSMSFEADSDEKEQEFDSNFKEVDKENSHVEDSVENSLNSLSKNTHLIEVDIEEKSPIHENSYEESSKTDYSSEHESTNEDDGTASIDDEPKNIEYCDNSFESNSKEGRRNYSGVDILSTIDEVSTQDDSNITIEQIEVDGGSEVKSEAGDLSKRSEISDTLIPDVNEIDFEKDLSENEFDLSHGDLSLEMSLNLDDEDDEDKEDVNQISESEQIDDGSGDRCRKKENIDSENELTLDRIDSIQADIDQTDFEEDMKDQIANDSYPKEDVIFSHGDNVENDDWVGAASESVKEKEDDIVGYTDKDDQAGQTSEQVKVDIESIKDEVTIESLEDITESPEENLKVTEHDRREDLSRKSESQDDVIDDLETESLVGTKDRKDRSALGGGVTDTSQGRCSESDHPSSEPLLSEGEIVQGRRGSEGEISLGGASGMEENATLESLAKENSASEGEVSAKQVSQVSSDEQGKMNRNERFFGDRTGGLESSSGVGEYLADYSASDGEAALRVAKKKSTASNSNRLRSIGSQRLGLGDTSTSSFSEGEWGSEVSPRQTQRFRNMAAAFRLNKK